MLTQLEMQLVSAEASDALDYLSRAMDGLASVSMTKDGRSESVLRLLRASLDNARGICQLLRHDPGEMAASALVLHRSQFEKLLRAIWFDSNTADEELQYFLGGKHPSFKDEKGKWQRYTFKQLASRAEAALKPVAQFPFTSLATKQWDQLCDLAHGGSETLKSYGDETDEIGCHFPAKTHFQILGNSHALINVALAIAYLRPSLDGATVEAATSELAELGRAYSAARSARMAKGGFVLREARVGGTNGGTP
jgi:hypothetical protein